MPEKRQVLYSRVSPPESEVALRVAGQSVEWNEHSYGRVILEFDPIRTVLLGKVPKEGSPLIFELV